MLCGVDADHVETAEMAEMQTPNRPAQLGSVWLLLGGGAFVLLIGALLGVVALTQQHAVAAVTHEGPCVNTSDAGLVCTEHVTYRAKNGRTYAAVIKGVHPDEVHGPSDHRTLAITYSGGSESDPTTDDMPNWVVFLLLGLGSLLIAWGSVRRNRNLHPRDENRIRWSDSHP
jgi:hypothetical protein